MNIWDIVGACTGVVIFILQIGNAYVTSRLNESIAEMRTDMAELKVFMYENFVSREDFERYKDDARKDLRHAVVPRGRS